MTSNTRRIFSLSKFVNYCFGKQNIGVTFKQIHNYRETGNKSDGFAKFSKYAFIFGGLGLGGGIYGYLAAPQRNNKPSNIILSEKKDFSLNPNIQNIKPSREVLGPASDLGLELHLYQYQTCPFCCKVRAFLDFYGIPYKVIEVNPVMRQQLKFSKYRKVPILIAEEKESSVQHQLNDSSVIISILGTYLANISSGLKSVLQYYAPVSYKDESGKEVEEVLNKYFIMYGDKTPQDSSDKHLQRERDWRKWADNEFVHVLSPNIYRTYDEALQAFNYFSEVGEWEKNFSHIERLVVIYVGATAMYFIGKKLTKKYALKNDVRQSLYDACRKWTKEINKHDKFHGGKKPNLADLSVYGMLNSIEGCSAFQDLLQNTNIGTWYNNVKEAVENHHGYNLLKK